MVSVGVAARRERDDGVAVLARLAAGSETDVEPSALLKTNGELLGTFSSTGMKMAIYEPFQCE